MTERQKLINGALAITNAIVILVLAVLLLRSFDSGDLPLPPSTPGSDGLAEPGRTPRPERLSGAPAQEDCQWAAAQMLAQAGLAGTTTLHPDGPLCFEIAHPLAPGAEADSAAQLIWVVFDVALALRQRDCEFTQVEVVILARGDQFSTRIEASVGAAALAALGAGELSEDEFVESVTYTTSPSQ